MKTSMNRSYIWTRKEALLKAMGIGLSGLNQSLDLVHGGDVFFDGVQWEVQDLCFTQGYAAALAVEGSILDIRIRSAVLMFRED